MSTARAAWAARAAWVLVAVASVAAIGLSLAARRGLANKTEMEPHLPRPAVPTPPPPAAKLPPPTEAELDAALRRTFGNAVVPEEGSLSLVGDFNGDGFQDIAVPVAPAPGRLAEINDPVAGWQLQDALAEPPSAVVPRGGTAAVVEPVKVGEADALLAVIHGYGPRGWRDEEARQCYLVRRAIGAPLQAQPKAILTQYVKRVPDNAMLDGDVILSSAGGRAGFVYWTGNRYAWHPLPSGARAEARTP